MLLWISLIYSKHIYVYTIKDKLVKYSAIEDNCTKNFVKKWRQWWEKFIGNYVAIVSLEIYLGTERDPLVYFSKVCVI